MTNNNKERKVPKAFKFIENVLWNCYYSLTEADYKNRKNGEVKGDDKAALFLEALGGSENIVDVTNCATRLRISVNDPDKVQDQSVFKQAGAHGLVKK